jgi:H+/Cl- antiporter ClcA
LFLAAVWLGLNSWFAHRRLKRPALSFQTKEELGLLNRSFLLLSAIAVFTETTLLAIQEYGDTAVTGWDTFQMKLEQLRTAPPVAALCVLILGSFCIWRKRMRPSENRSATLKP